MATTTENTYVGNGSTVLYSFTFPYLDVSDVYVSVNGTDQALTTEYVYANATTVQFLTPPASGAAIRIYRSTSSEDLKAVFFPGSAIRSTDLNDNFSQALYVVQEATNTADGSTGAAAQALTIANSAETAATNAVTTATSAQSDASAAVVTANSSAATATAAATNANNASTAANAAVTTANAASATATTAAGQVATAASDAATAISTANSAVSTANSASTSAASALSAANSAASTANTATTTANSANSSASSAVTTANTASTNASSALSTANTANTNATTALNNSRESNGSGGFNSAIDKANTAITTANSASTSATSAVSTANTASTNASTALTAANAATAAVSAAGLSTSVANVSAIPGSPSNNDLVEVVNSTGIQSFTPLSGVPTGFTGSSVLTVRIRYDSSASSWVWTSYFNNDSEATYLKKSTPVVVGDSTNGSGQITLNCENNSHGVKIKGPPHSAAATYTLTLPNDTGSNGQALLTNGSGVTSWGTVTTDISSKANIASPTFTGTPAGPTAASGTNTTQLATTAFVTAAVAAGGGGGGGSSTPSVIDPGNFDNGTSLVSSSNTIDAGDFD